MDDITCRKVVAETIRLCRERGKTVRPAASSARPGRGVEAGRERTSCRVEMPFSSPSRYCPKARASRRQAAGGGDGGLSRSRG